MKRKTLSLLLCIALLAGILAGCGGTPVAVVDDSDAPVASPSATTPDDSTPDTVDPEPDAYPVKTGLFFNASLGGSQPASAEAEGLAQADITLVAVTVDDAGVIDRCVIDAIQSQIHFDSTGKITTPMDTAFATKRELGDEYGMRAVSSIGKEWNEQLAALAEYAEGKTVEELKTMAVDETGKAADADLASSVTLYIGSFVSAIEGAVANATHLGAQKGNELHLSAITTMSDSVDASGDKNGLAEAYATVAAVTTNGATVTSCYIDAMKAGVAIAPDGSVLTDTTVAPLTKNDLGDEYGMRAASSIGKEWYEQAAAFSRYVTGKTLAEVGSIAVSDSGAPADADLASSVTLSIGTFQNLLTKLA